MKLFGLLSIALILVMLLSNCKGSKKTTDDSQLSQTETPDTLSEKNHPFDINVGTGQLVVEMSKSACFGRCPVFTLKILDNGRIEYRGILHTEKLGMYSRKLEDSSFYQVMHNLQGSDLWQYDDFYSSGATDFPMTSITYHRGDSSKTIKGDFERPEAVRILEKQLETIANAGDWLQEEALVPYAAIKDELIVELQADFNASDLEENFSEMGLKIKNRIAPNLDLWVYHFDTEKANAGKMMVLLKAHHAVKRVEFNQKLNQRN